MRYCGRHFAAAEIELIRELIALSPPISRYQLSREVCARLNWRRADGKLKDMSCRVAMLRMQADDLFTLPPPRNAKPVAYRAHPGIESAVLAPTTTPSVDLARLRVELVANKPNSLLWNAYIERHHYLGHQLLPGAQLRYFIRAEGGNSRFARLRRERLENQTARLLHRLDQPTAPAQLAPPRQQRALPHPAVDTMP